MKIMFSSLLFCLLLIRTVSAQNPSPQPEPDFLTGKGLLFKFEGLANLGLNSFSGGVGFKYNLDESTWLRHILSIRSHHLNQHSRGSESNSSAVGIDLNTDYIIDMAKRNQLKPFWGGGFSVGFGKNYSQGGTSFSENERTRNSYSFGTNGLLGVEYFLKENISLSAEYTVKILFSYSEEISASTNKTTAAKIKTFSIDRGILVFMDRFGLVASFYL